MVCKKKKKVVCHRVVRRLGASGRQSLEEEPRLPLESQICAGPRWGPDRKLCSMSLTGQEGSQGLTLSKTHLHVTASLNAKWL